MKRVDPAVVGLVIGIGAAVALLWVGFRGDPADTTWTDPQQPPAMVAPLVGFPTGRKGRPQRCRDYPDSLASWDQCVVGDC